MRRPGIILTAVITVITAAVCFAGCKDESRIREEVLKTSEQFADALIDCNTKQIAKLSDGLNDSVSDMMEMRLTDRISSEVKSRVIYTIDEDIEIESETAIVDMTFQVEDIGKKIVSTMELEQSEDKWLVVNSGDVLEDFYKAIDALNISRPASESIKEINWLYNPKQVGSGEYTDVDMIGLEVVFNGEFTGGDYYYTVRFRDQEVYKSDTQSGKFTAEFGVRTPGATTNSIGHLESGQYVFEFYDLSGTKLLDAKCSVEQATAPKISVEGGVSSGAKIDDPDKVESVKWWWYDSDSGDTITYTDASLIHLELTYKPGIGVQRGYFEVAYEGFTVYTSEIRESDKNIGGVYMFIEDNAPLDANRNLAGGTYEITFYDESGKRLASDTCLVIGKSTDDMKPVTKDDVDHLYWVGALKVADDTEFSNVDGIELALILKDSAKGSPVRYSVLYNGEVVYSSLLGPQSANAHYKSGMKDVKLDANGKLAEGEYVIRFYSSDGSEIASGKCVITND